MPLELRLGFYKPIYSEFPVLGICELQIVTSVAFRISGCSQIRTPPDHRINWFDLSDAASFATRPKREKAKSLAIKECFELEGICGYDLPIPSGGKIVGNTSEGIGRVALGSFGRISPITVLS